jgi:hypothetical protein
MQDHPPGGHPSDTAADTTAGAIPPLGRYYGVGGRRLLLYRSGSGSPAAVFLAGGARSAWTT